MQDSLPYFQGRVSMSKENPPKWYKVYKELAKKLAETNGVTLYKKCIEDSKFSQLNTWVERPKKRGSLDPMHIFASINASKLREDTRINRINRLFYILDKPSGEEKYKKIDFNGCPAPVTIRLMSARSTEQQEEIWDAFKRIVTKPKEFEIKFDKVKSWYGIAIQSFTQLLFWSNYEYFLPLDKHTQAFLKRYDKIGKEPQTWSDYRALLKEIEKTDKKLYRILALIAWDDDFLLQEEDKKILTKFINSTDNLIDKIKKDSLINNGFSFIYIKVLSNYKIFKKGDIYRFNTAYSIKNDGIYYYPKQDIDIFSSKKANFKVSINAIVGKNGSGKSTLIEMLFDAISNIKSKNNNKINIEICFKSDEVYKVRIEKNKYKKIKCERINDDKEQKTDYVVFKEESKSNHSDIIDIGFYSALFNYSIHGLNSKDSSQWIERSKKETIPITIEPRRDSGPIDIEKLERTFENNLISILLEKSDEGNDSNAKINPNYKVSLIGVEKNKIDNTINKFLSDKECDIKNGLVNFKYYDLDKIVGESYSDEIDISLGVLFKDCDIRLVKCKDKDCNIESSKTKNSSTIALKNLSSGEKQEIYSRYSIVKELKDINNKNKYSYVNIVLDEIELYFHPELQRTYINNLLSAIKKLDLNIDINIIFITHSPFILSDIPKNRILFLGEKGEKITRTFGANIHELLLNGFFMDSSMGEFARNKIQEIVGFSKGIKEYEKKKKEFYFVADNIGDDYIRSVIKNHLLDMESKFKSDDYIKGKIKNLEKEIEKLKKSKMEKKEGKGSV